MSLIEMWSAEDAATKCSVICSYDPARIIFVVEVSKSGVTKSKEFPAAFEPSFGIDMLDLSKANEIACLLADSFEE